MKFLSIIMLFISTIVNIYSQENKTLIVGYELSSPFVVKTNGKLHGPSVWLWEKIAEENNIPYKYVEFTFDKLLKGLSNKTIDVALSPLTITSKRSKKMDFSTPYYIAHSSLIEKDMSTLQSSLKFISAFFSINFFRALGVLAIIILVFGFLVWIFERKGNKEEFEKGIKGLWSGFWWSAVTMTTVGYGDKSPKTVGGRIIALFWMFTAIIVISGLTASISSSLTIYKSDSANNTIQNFKNKTIGTIKNSGTDEWLKRNFFTNKKTFYSIAELLDALDKDDIKAIAYDRPILQTIINANKSERYRLLDIKYYPQFYAMAMNRDLPEKLKHDINLKILSNIEKMDWKVLLSEYDFD
jgi:ABC-type amino acid transport substrate-binding protein